MAYNSIYTGQQIDDAVRDGEWYNLRCWSAVRSTAPSDYQVVIENYVPKLSDPEQYRLVYMHQCRASGKGLVWRIPMFGALRGTLGSRPLAETFVSVAGRLTVVSFSDEEWAMKNVFNKDLKARGRFCKSSNTRRRVGYALFKRTQVGTFGWQRVSDIVGICASQGNKDMDKRFVLSVFSA